MYDQPEFWQPYEVTECERIEVMSLDGNVVLTLCACGRDHA
jgi:hypothetical protein